MNVWRGRWSLKFVVSLLSELPEWFLCVGSFFTITHIENKGLKLTKKKPVRNFNMLQCLGWEKTGDRRTWMFRMKCFSKLSPSKQNQSSSTAPRLPALEGSSKQKSAVPHRRVITPSLCTHTQEFSFIMTWVWHSPSRTSAGLLISPGSPHTLQSVEKLKAQCGTLCDISHCGCCSWFVACAFAQAGPAEEAKVFIGGSNNKRHWNAWLCASRGECVRSHKLAWTLELDQKAKEKWLAWPSPALGFSRVFSITWRRTKDTPHRWTAD